MMTSKHDNTLAARAPSSNDQPDISVNAVMEQQFRDINVLPA
jgi:hypothetical protein